MTPAARILLDGRDITANLIPAPFGLPLEGGGHVIPLLEPLLEALHALEEIAHVEAVIAPVIAFVALLGWISIVRGFFIVRGVAEGNSQASMLA